MYFQAVLRQVTDQTRNDRNTYRLKRMRLLVDTLQEMGWFDNPQNNVGETMSRLSNDISAIRSKENCTRTMAGWRHVELVDDPLQLQVQLAKL